MTVSFVDGYGLPVYINQNDLWYVPDRDYTPNFNYISAVWNRLRYHTYKVAVIRYRSMDVTTYYKPVNTLDLPDPCSHPDAIACTDTGKSMFDFLYNSVLYLKLLK